MVVTRGGRIYQVQISNVSSGKFPEVLFKTSGLCLSSFAAHVADNLRKIALSCFNITLLKRVTQFIHTSALLI